MTDRPTPTAEAERLHALLAEHWQWMMDEHPESATAVGWAQADHTGWTDHSAEAYDRRRRVRSERLAQVQGIDRAALSDGDVLNADLLQYDLEMAVEGGRFPSELMPVTQMGGVQQSPAYALTLMPMAKVDDGAALVARLRNLPPVIDRTIEQLREGLAAGVTPPQVVLRDVAEQIVNMSVAGVDSPLVAPLDALTVSVPAAEHDRLRAEAAAVVDDAVRPAYGRLHDFFGDEYLPRTRTTIACVDLPDGEAWYDHSVRRYTTTEMSPKEIHELGLAEVARIREAMHQVIADADFGGDFAAWNEMLRTDPRFFHTSAEALLTEYRDIAKRADPELARLFGVLPRNPYGVKPIPSYAERSQTTAYYSRGAQSAGRAGIFYANTYDLPSRPRWEMEALTLHEAVPGHHLQISLQQELEGLPELRKNPSYTGYIEGWGLYAESLGEEMGFYTDPYSRYGQLTYEMWRAIRLVVDTGMHSLGWSRDQAIEYFEANSAKARHDIVVEIDRYITWPGQALAYKLGELTFKRLRRRATDELGGRFDVRAFHDQVLKDGALPLRVLEQRFESWLSTQTAAAS